MSKKFLLVVAFAVAAPVAPTLAQSTRVPSEIPPASYTESQYVDSSGCVYVRAGFNGSVTWVPRYGNDRQPMCGFIPSLGGGASQVAETPLARPGPPPVTVSAPEGATSGIRIRTVASVAPEPAAPAPRVRSRQGAVAAAPRAPEIATQQVYLSDTPGYATERRQSNSFGRAFCGLNPCVTGDTPGLMHGATASMPTARSPGASGGAIVIAADQGQPAPRQRRSGAGQMTGGQYVQVGVYGSATNATAAIANLQSNGMPVATARGVSGGSEYRVVLAGPFSDPGQLSAALHRTRAMGYSDAFVR